MQVLVLLLTQNDIQTNDGAIVHDNLSGFVANEHIDHTSITLTAGTGLTGGGTIAANRTFKRIRCYIFDVLEPKHSIN